MSIVRVSIRHRFVVIDKTGLEDPQLSFKATGLLAYLLSKPDDWTVSYRGLADAKTDGKHAVMAALRELEEAGYLARECRSLGRGEFEWEQIVYEVPPDRAPVSDQDRAPVLRAPKTGAYKEERTTEEPSSLQELVDKSKTGRKLSSEEDFAKEHLVLLHAAVEQGRFDNVHEAYSLVVTEASRQAARNGLKTSLVLRAIYADYFFTITDQSPDYPLLGKLAKEFGAEGFFGLRESLSRPWIDAQEARGWYAYARRVCLEARADASD